MLFNVSVFIFDHYYYLLSTFKMPIHTYFSFFVEYLQKYMHILNFFNFIYKYGRYLQVTWSYYWFIFISGARKMIYIGEKLVDFNQNFKLFMVTHELGKYNVMKTILPCPVINFNTSINGLMEQVETKFSVYILLFYIYTMYQVYKHM